MRRGKIESYTDKFVNRFTRALFFLAGDTFSLIISALAAFLILNEFAPTERSFPVVHSFGLVVTVIAGLAFLKMYQATWRFISLTEMARIFAGMLLGGVVFLAVAWPFSVFGRFEFAFTGLTLVNGFLLIGGFRISKRLLYELVYSPPKSKDKKHTIIYGGESAGEQIMRDIIRNDHWNLSVRAIFDDEVMAGIRIHGIRIMGGSKHLVDYIRYNHVELLIVANPEISKKHLKNVIDQVKQIRPEMDIKVLPTFHMLTDDPVGVQNIREISIEDILGREPVNIDINSIKESITGKTVMVTGAGGSIGSELVRQCAKLDPEKLVALDIDETELFHIDNELRKSGFDIVPCVANVTDIKKMDAIFRKVKPDVIFHAAAYKHVPMMENFPDEAIKVNIGGTKIVSELACKHRVEKFIMVSTDKAVNPTNVMGASKRVAEEICMSHNGSCVTKFIAVRFGNVLGSRGSVVPLFIEQIKDGGPVTITDPEMKRYFMTIPEAVLLVMQAGSMGDGGEVFVLDMGEPVKIIDMARDLIRLHGLKPEEDIQFTYTGLRPGEKLFEELLNAEEGVADTQHSEIFKAICSNRMDRNELRALISLLFDQVENGGGDHISIRNVLQKMVPSYTYKEEMEAMGILDKKARPGKKISGHQESQFVEG